MFARWAFSQLLKKKKKLNILHYVFKNNPPLPPKILDRKNGEIEEMKSLYRAKQKESEEMIRKLEKKGERSRDCRVNGKDVYTSVSEHSA